MKIENQVFILKKDVIEFLKNEIGEASFESVKKLIDNIEVVNNEYLNVDSVYSILDAFYDDDELLDEFIAKNFKKDIKIQGVFAVTDEQAVDFINKLKEYNIEVPKDVQVVGFDGSKSSAKDIIKISTIRQPVELIAEESVKALVNIIENNKVEKEIILPVTFVEGYTTRR